MTMGYKGTPRAVRIAFAEGHEHYGAEARVRRMSYGEWEAVVGVDGAGETSAMAEFAKRLVSWNLTDDDEQPIPATPEGMRQVDTSLITALKDAWVQALTGVHDADPLPQSSPSGEPSPVESIPTEALSPSLAS
ncbi:hypothetical protein [Streptomyces sp. NPDC029554]|uniref:hypothetical protein n=1 Tax=Streptomyces sp. NPDC029554 TaxID=3155126 RepID=UPI0033D3E8A6